MSFTRLLLGLAGIAACTALALLVTAAANVSGNLGALVGDAPGAARQTSTVAPSSPKQAPLRSADPEIESPLDVVLADGTAKRAPALPMPPDQVEWTEVPYPDDTNGRVFASFGSDVTEAQAEVGAMFDEMLDDFSLQAETITANPGTD